MSNLTKQEEFLWIVQTMVLANALNTSTFTPITPQKRILLSASGVFITMDEAVRASGMIPEDMTAAEAANEFCTFALENLREDEETASGRTMDVPHWFARY
jgi:hypothetical protein